MKGKRIATICLGIVSIILIGLWGLEFFRGGITGAISLIKSPAVDLRCAIYGVLFGVCLFAQSFLIDKSRKKLRLILKVVGLWEIIIASLLVIVAAIMIAAPHP